MDDIFRTPAFDRAAPALPLPGDFDSPNWDDANWMDAEWRPEASPKVLPEPKFSVRASSLAEAMDCARRWAARLLMASESGRAILDDAGFKLRELPTNIGAIVGSGFHAGAGHLNVRLAKSGKVGGRKRRAAALEAAIAEMTERAQDGVQLDDTTPTMDQAHITVAAMLDRQHTSMHPDDEPVIVEKGLKMRVGPASVTGTLDLFLIRGRLRDYKTGRNKPKFMAQGGTYSLLLRANKRGEPKEVEVCYHERKKRPELQKPPVMIPYSRGACEREALATIHQTHRMLETFLADLDPIEAFPGNNQSLMCSDRFCPAYGTSFCHLWREKEAIA